ncbi:MAG: AmmeMemoRadiSam system protein A [Clostridiaceae bacterium]|nr:AmmeMemoRadiSam system protein A [Clostridiaceae bacterium]
MGKVTGAYIVPHPPVIVPEVGRGRESEIQKTIDSFKRVAREIKEENPGTIIVITPHAPFFRDFIYVNDSDKIIKGDLGRFGAPGVRLEFENNVQLARRIVDNALQRGIGAGGMSYEPLKRMLRYSVELDHGALVPLYFINKEAAGFKLVHMAVADLPFDKLYDFGRYIGKAITETDGRNGRTVIIASGDLSHSLTWDAPCGYNPKGKVFDRLIAKYVAAGDVESIVNFDRKLAEEAAECGLRPIIILMGALEGYSLCPEVYSYEGPFGVGYMVAGLKTGVDVYVRLARLALETYVKERKIINPWEVMPPLPREMMENRAGTFVSLKKEGFLRGCIGTIQPTRENIAEEIVYNAISSGTRDPRFTPVTEDELDLLVYSVDILMEPEPVNSIEELDVYRYGVIVRSRGRTGLLLPNIEGVDTPWEQVSIALQKAGISPGEKYTMERFEVIRHKEA